MARLVTILEGVSMAKTIIKFLDDLSPSELKLRDLPRKPDGLYNLAFNEYGQVVKRAGYAQYNTTSIGASHKIVGMHRFYKQDTSTKEFIVAWNTKLYEIAETTPWGATALKSKAATDYTQTADADTYFATFANHCYIANGEDNLQKYNGTYIRSVNMTVPGAPTFNSRVDGALTAGNYYFKYTFVDEDGYESNGGTASAVMTAQADPNDGIKINIAVSADDKVDKRRIYRTTVGGSIYYYDGEVADNTTTTYSSVLADSVISLKSILHTDHNAPPASPSLVVKRLSRLNIAVDDSLYVSKNYDKTTGVRSVEYFPSTNYFPTGNGQNINGLIEQLGELPLFTEDTIERLVGTDEDNFELRNAHQEDGCISKRSAVNCKNYVVYLAFNGIYIFDGVSARAIDFAFDGRLNKYIRDNINYSYAHLSCATYYKNKYLLCIPTGANTVPNVTIYYDFETKSYGVYSFAFSCFSKWDKGGDGLSLKGGSNTIGRVYSVFSGLDDDGSAITAYDDIEPYDFGMPEIYKQFYSIFIKIKSTTATTLTMNYTLDNGSEVTSQTKTIEKDTTKWYRISLVSGGNRGRSIALRPYISDKFYFEIHGLAFCFDTEPFSEEKE